MHKSTILPLLNLKRKLVMKFSKYVLLLFLEFGNETVSETNECDLFFKTNQYYEPFT